MILKTRNPIANKIPTPANEHIDMKMIDPTVMWRTTVVISTSGVWSRGTFPPNNKRKTRIWQASWFEVKLMKMIYNQYFVRDYMPKIWTWLITYFFSGLTSYRDIRIRLQNQPLTSISFTDDISKGGSWTWCQLIKVIEPGIRRKVHLPTINSVTRNKSDILHITIFRNTHANPSTKVRFGFHVL